ncbi:hypothetical protein Aple_037260 [Acrocarpospora pleiomorpha]|uniref:CHAT domain-containing protein n=1 Tax=Acrocarpospora pleiomorpha TaxID=90975 RepID=A0A5M3XIR0_9ACTN|nr:CHAT domain-containing protein [Acrocarpospora pleiomorpha]GES20830.1 hypothetical protein Aple_037260 [Acrocarpospora pleiomorpha]
MTADTGNRHTREADRRIALAREWDGLVERVRQLDEFRDFLRPPSPGSLLSAARHGPVVVVNVSRWRCDALVVRPDGVRVVELPGLTADEVSRRTFHYLRVLQAEGQFDPTLPFTAALEARARALRERDDVLRSTMEWLWDSVAGPVLTALRLSPVAPGQVPPRLWWCPTGLLTLLPLHGAGYHAAADGRAVLDHVVSSYTPTLRALGEALRPSPSETAPGPDRLLFVGVPDVPDQLQLVEDVAREHHFLNERFPGGLTVVEGRNATMGSVQQAMAEHRWVHLSCHGYQDITDPSMAGLELSDGTLTVLRLSANRYAGDFAFLSACRTATGGLHVPDEAITLAAALSYTGYRHVVATLWAVDPAVAAEVTAAVYPALISPPGVFDPESAAIALHKAVRDLRDSGRPLDHWLPFTHTGP